MPRLRLIKAAKWSEVEQIATTLTKCIRPDGGSNNPRAKQTWDTFGSTDDVIYFVAHPTGVIEPQGYIRLLRVLGFAQGASNPTYVADFITPSLYTLVKLAKEQLPGATIWCKSFTAEDEVWVKGWPRARAAFVKLEMYPYHVQNSGESEWIMAQ